MNLWERDPKLYEDVYIKGIQQETSYLALGKKVAEALEKGESDEAGIEFLVNFFPSYPKREYPLKAEFEGIPLYGKLDGFDPEIYEIGEYKTGTKFTQGMVDASGQLTFYVTLVWLCFGIKPEKVKIKLHWARTESVDGQPKIIGEIKTFETKRTMRDVIAFYPRCERAWKGIQKLSEKALSIIQ